ncbi:MAG TPA: hypothetical protein VD837_00745 [Terriglobales bacterium]|nr:hypothetical protein [Terriglobales bacterium]
MDRTGNNPAENFQSGSDPAADTDLHRDPEDRPVEDKRKDIKDKMLDKTIADSFPTSDPPSSIPDPSECEDEDSSRAA